MNGITHARIVEIVGDIDDVRAAEILATGANEEEIEEAAAWASGLDHPGKDTDRPLTGVVAQVYEILTSDETFADDDRD